ncbi:MAG: formate dehydrogenase subunit delta [Acidobacteriota bacterium]
MIRSANQIALFFATYPHDEGLAGVRDHLRLYWEPRMRTQIKKYVAEGGSGLHALAMEAVKQLE